MGLSKQSASQLWLRSGLPESALSQLFLPQPADPSVNSTFKLGTAAQTSIGLAGLAAAHFHFLRTGVSQNVIVSARDAVIEFHSEAFYTLSDSATTKRNMWDDIAGLYQTKDDGYVRIHTNFPHHRAGILSILSIPTSPGSPLVTRECVASALSQWDSKELEETAANRGMCATALRSFEEWDMHPQAKALINTPPVSIHKIGEAPPRHISADKKNLLRPLQGIRVLDLTRVIAGPTGGRTLAAHGADVLWITSPNLPSLPLLDADTSRGKRTAQLDLNVASDRETLRRLATESDVFLQGYRPGGLDEKGFSVQELANLRPGIVCANLRAWGWDGPWRDRRAFDSLIQTATGFNVAEGQAHANTQSETSEFKPRPLPMQALDHAAGYFLAYGITAALCRIIMEGGSWEVRVSLAAVGQWIRQLGRLDPRLAFRTGRPLPSGPLEPEIKELSSVWPVVSTTARKNKVYMTAVKHAAKLSMTPVKEGDTGIAPLALDVHGPTWL